MYPRLKPLAAAALLCAAAALPARAGESIPITHYGAGLYGAVASNACGPSSARTACILTSPDGAS